MEIAPRTIIASFLLFRPKPRKENGSDATGGKGTLSFLWENSDTSSPDFYLWQRKSKPKETDKNPPT
jgi:hypothetical protein